MNDREHVLRIYLRDHEAAAVGGLQLFRRCSNANAGTVYGTDLRRLTSEVQADRDALRDICGRFDVKYSNLGRAAAVVGATVGRLKTNGRLLTYSPLSRVIELEALSSGVMAKLRLWESLVCHAETEPRLDPAEMAQHVTDANEQLATLRRLHDMAADDAFG
jgi:hypothetical protein